MGAGGSGDTHGVSQELLAGRATAQARAATAASRGTMEMLDPNASAGPRPAMDNSARTVVICRNARARPARVRPEQEARDPGRGCGTMPR
jgi:hypothetical protein